MTKIESITQLKHLEHLKLHTWDTKLIIPKTRHIVNIITLLINRNFTTCRQSTCFHKPSIKYHPQSLFIAGFLSRMKIASSILLFTWEGSLAKLHAFVNGKDGMLFLWCVAKCAPQGVPNVFARACWWYSLNLLRKDLDVLPPYSSTHMKQHIE